LANNSENDFDAVKRKPATYTGSALSNTDGGSDCGCIDSDLETPTNKIVKDFCLAQATCQNRKVCAYETVLATESESKMTAEDATLGCELAVWTCSSSATQRDAINLLKVLQNHHYHHKSS
jgi:hypothetical protein